VGLAYHHHGLSIRKEVLLVVTRNPRSDFARINFLTARKVRVRCAATAGGNSAQIARRPRLCQARKTLQRRATR